MLIAVDLVENAVYFVPKLLVDLLVFLQVHDQAHRLHLHQCRNPLDLIPIDLLLVLQRYEFLLLLEQMIGEEAVKCVISHQTLVILHANILYGDRNQLLHIDSKIRPALEI